MPLKCFFLEIKIKTGMDEQLKQATFSHLPAAANRPTQPYCIKKTVNSSKKDSAQWILLAGCHFARPRPALYMHATVAVCNRGALGVRMAQQRMTTTALFVRSRRLGGHSFVSREGMCKTSGINYS